MLAPPRRACPRSATGPTPSKSGRSTAPATPTRRRRAPPGPSTPPRRTTSIDAGPSGLTNNANASFAFSGTDTGGSGVASLPVQPRTVPRFAACTTPQAYSSLSRRLPHLRSPGDRRRRQRRPDPGELHLDRRHHRADGHDRLRALRPDQRSDAYLHLQLRGGGELRMLDRHRHAQLRAMLGTRDPHTVLAAGRRPIHVPGAGDGCRDQFRDRGPRLHARHVRATATTADGDDPCFARKPELTKGGGDGSGGIDGEPLHHRRLFGLSNRDDDRRGTGSRRHGLGPG